jgi:hypothetical protein
VPPSKTQSSENLAIVQPSAASCSEGESVLFGACDLDDRQREMGFVIFWAKSILPLMDLSAALTIVE